jgi:nucleotide-binding universal stress UspA family protein
MMIRLNRILLPTDFSDHSKQAAKYACAFAEQFGAELHLLHVLQDLVAMVPEPGLAFPPPGDYMQELTASAEKGLAGFLDPQWAAGKNIVRETRQGPPFLEIVRYAKENNIDLIVLGTHGRSGLAHMLLGSVAEKVVRKAPCPVLTVRPEEHEFVMP